MALGDFNEIMWDTEKEGRGKRSEWQMEACRSAVENADLHDLGFTRPKFTWERGNTEISSIRERLDRAATNRAWMGKFSHFLVRNLACSYLDHYLLLVTTERAKAERRCLFAKRKQVLEAIWANEHDCKSIVAEAWANGDNKTMRRRLQWTRNRLYVWGKEKFQG
ncbi:uncharacterized protein LOC111276360 [Durio zibethinus]|uniref:Uncharacterized protein LOC111276360 n=1 Tax=Durio zibethinus TaxID=66656 RepID=A0A6P5WQ50_DURZI|nr:uncharacterized protein LOC111276360 [Durio zibethinus]